MKHKPLYNRFRKFTLRRLNKNHSEVQPVKPSGIGKVVFIWGMIGLVLYVFSNMHLNEPFATRNHLDSSGELVVKMRNNHFYFAGKANDVNIEFLYDTGATKTSLPTHMMTKLGVFRCTGYESVNTANGKVRTCKATLPDLAIGPFHFNNVPVCFLPNLKDPLLGMNVLNRFQIIKSGNTLTVRPDKSFF